MFCINEKGDSWAYATPGFGEALVPDHLRSMRVMGTRTMEAAQARPPSSPSLTLYRTTCAPCASWAPAPWRPPRRARFPNPCSPGPMLFRREFSCWLLNLCVLAGC